MKPVKALRCLFLGTLLLGFGIPHSYATSVMGRISFNLPGLSARLLCSTSLFTPCTFGAFLANPSYLTGRTRVDAADYVYGVDNTLQDPACGNTMPRIFRLHADGSTELVLTINSSCAEGPASIDGLDINLLSGKIRFSTGENTDPIELVEIVGLPSLLDLIQTYVPQTTAIFLRVPAMPEGLPSADHFDTYWGNLATLPDFTKAQPMACSYPASPPAVGEFLTVPDTSPTPPLGQANYILTSVTHGTDRRYGRQLTGPTMTGRDPALLPVCR